MKEICILSEKYVFYFLNCILIISFNLTKIYLIALQHLFAENKEKLIHGAITAIISEEVADFKNQPVEEIEQQFHALRRLVASKAGFSAFTSMAGFREKIGVRVAQALKLGHDGVSHAAIDMICALMEPMHDNYDLNQEQLNKCSLLSSEKFLDGLLDMWSIHVVNVKFAFHNLKK